MGQNVIISDLFRRDLAAAISECEHDRTFVLVDETTRVKCWERIKDCFSLKGARLVTVGATDSCKTVETLIEVWKALQEGGATRHSLLVNLGGGMVTDLGGFAASTFKRGINFINVPTTLLAMVDASVGGKTGVNFGGLKNEIGVFNDASFVLLDTGWLKTLDEENIRSGYAEMLKHGLIADEAMWAELADFDLAQPDLAQLSTMIGKSVRVKERIVEEDPKEHGIRKALNFGHTIGHAYESLSFKKDRPLLHGHAVAAGIVSELYLSHKVCGFPMEKLSQVVYYLKEYYPAFVFDCKDYDTLYELMTHDKKNEAGVINFTLLSQVGDVQINQQVSKEKILESLDFYRESFGV